MRGPAPGAEAGCRQAAEQALAALRTAGRTLATAESCTGGLVGAFLTEIPGSSHVYQGGVCVYTEAAKSLLLGLEPTLLSAAGVVSETVARAMALAVAFRLRADYGLATTGIAGPAGGSPATPRGMVWCALAGPGEVVVTFCLQLPGDRSAVRRAAVEKVLAELASFVLRS